MRRGCWWGILGVGTLAVYAGVRVFTVFWDFGQAASELPQAIRDYRAQSLPWTAAALERNVPDGENAAHLLRRAIGVLPGPSTRSAFDTATFSGAVSFDLAPFKPSLRIVHQAVRYPKLDFHRDWDQGPLLLFSEGPQIKRLTKALAMRAEQRAAKGDHAGAIRDLDDARRLAALAGQEQTLIAGLVSVACETNVLAASERCLAHGATSPEALAKYRDWLSNPPPLPDMVQAMGFEIYSSLVFVRNIDRLGGLKSSNPLRDFDFMASEEGIATPSEGMRRDGVPPAVRARAYMARHHQSWAELYRRTNGLRADGPTVKRVWLEIDERNYRSRGWSYQLGSILFPTFIQAMATPRKLQSSRNKALALAKVLELKQRTGRWPTSVSEDDALGKGPLLARFDGKRFRVWSVGRNGIDDGGITSEEARAVGKKSDDLVAAYPPVPRIATKRTTPASSRVPD